MSKKAPVEIENIHTPCKNCIFADYRGKTQHGCKLARISAFKKQGSVVEAEDKEKEFFIINGRICNAFHQHGDAFSKTFPHSEWVSTIRKMLALRLTVMVVMENGVDTQVLDKTIEALQKQELPPHQFIVINNQSIVSPGEFHARLYKKLGNSMTWRITQIFEKTVDGKFVSRERAIDHGMGGVTGGYYSVFSAGFAPPPNFISDLDKALNERMERFSLLTPNAANEGLTVQTDMHKHPQINGNAEVSCKGENGETIVLHNVAEKIAYYAKIQDKPFLVKNVTDICKF